MLWNICSILFVASIGAEGLKEYTFRKRLEREGYEINDNRTTTEKVLSFIRNYAYLLVPGYNIYKAGKKLFSEEDVYYNKRFNSFKSKGLIKKINKEEVKESKEETKEIKKEVKEEPKKEIKKEVKQEEKGYTLEEMINMKNYYANQDKTLRNKYKTLKEKGASTSTLNDIVRTIKEVDKKYYELDEAILKEKSHSSSKKLIK